MPTLIDTPIAAPQGSVIAKPEFFRLPKSGTRDPYFGLCRSAYYELEGLGAFRMTRLRKRGATRGTTLIPFDAVYDFIRTHEGGQLPNMKGSQVHGPGHQVGGAR
ncbi:MAG: hypothetical protein QOH88_3455 [Verrucomicrobiota bacterium]|jgi:hypothetical protein